MTKIEEVARAMQASKAWPAVFGAGTATTLAIAAVTAMREPTEIMCRAGTDPSIMGEDDALYIWQNMIAAALAEHDDAARRARVEV